MLGVPQDRSGTVTRADRLPSLPALQMQNPGQPVKQSWPMQSPMQRDLYASPTRIGRRRSDSGYSFVSHTPSRASIESRTPKCAPIPVRRISIRADSGYGGVTWWDSSMAMRPQRDYFKGLPEAVYMRIMSQLEIWHEDPRNRSCTKCYLKDIRSLALTSRAWAAAATKQRYAKIWIHLNDDNQSSKMAARNIHARLDALIRTVLDNRTLTAQTTEIIIPDFQAVFDRLGGSMEWDGILSRLAKLVYLCPTLEALTGAHMAWTFQTDDLTRALATRRHLREKVWVIEQPKQPKQPPGLARSTSQRISVVFADTAAAVVDKPKWSLARRLAGGRDDASGTPRSKRLSRSITEPPEPSPRDLCDDFLRLHENWSQLQSLVLYGPGANKSCMEYPLLVSLFKTLPSLSSLLIASFHPDDFDDSSLSALPAGLQSLRLQNLPGVTDQGLLDLATSSAVASLTRLSLIDINIKHLHVLAFLIKRAPILRKLTFVQLEAPYSTSRRPVFLSSKTLKHLHWDTTRPGRANVDLANSIRLNCLPSLTTLRSPCDHTGILQSLCKPTGRIAHATDAAAARQIATERFFASQESSPSSPSRHTSIRTLPDKQLQNHIELSFPVSPASSTTSSTTSSTVSSPSSTSTAASSVTSLQHLSITTPGTPLPSARLAAQSRIDSARLQAGTRIVVQDECGHVQKVQYLGSYVGTLSSRITFTLEPDVPAREAAIFDLSDLSLCHRRRRAADSNTHSGAMSPMSPSASWFRRRGSLTSSSTSSGSSSSDYFAARTMSLGGNAVGRSRSTRATGVDGRGTATGDGGEEADGKDGAVWCEGRWNATPADWKKSWAHVAVRRGGVMRPEALF